jgi:hypothetical protein
MTSKAHPLFQERRGLIAETSGTWGLVLPAKTLNVPCSPPQSSYNQRMFDLRATLLKASDALQKRNVAHALIGGFALAFHGINRATADVDFLADGTNRAEILQALQNEGFILRFESSEVLQFTGIGNLDILLANRPISQQMLKDAILQQNLPVYLLRVEDIIGLKIQAYINDPSRELQDKADIQQLMNRHPGLDWQRVKNLADIFDQWPTIEKLRNKP